VDDAYRKLYGAQMVERIGLIRNGVKASDAKAWLNMPSIATGVLLEALDLPVATFNRKVKWDEKLSKAESERVVGFARLVGQLEAMIDEAGDPTGFDARSWISRWLTEPLPALGHAKPIDYMDTMEGQNLVSQKLAQISSGAYA
jgi:putative toxin-antitoxin system antitoxin component (TIGR02293 family)